MILRSALYFLGISVITSTGFSLGQWSKEVVASVEKLPSEIKFQAGVSQSDAFSKVGQILDKPQDEAKLAKEILAKYDALSSLYDAAPVPKKWLPIVIMHGMNQDAHKQDRNQAVLKKMFPGIYITSLPIYENFASMVTDMKSQMNAVVHAIRNDTNLKEGFNFYGESQGALIARAYVTGWNDPPVHNLVAINGPQSGVGECPHVEIPYIKEMCGDLGTDLDIYAWPYCAFCSYWKGKNKKHYLANSAWLKEMNNDRMWNYNNLTGIWTPDSPINQNYRNNMKSLKKYMVTRATEDETVQPGDSAWHTYWKWDDDVRNQTMRLEETEGYKHDVLGLRTLMERGDMILNEFEGGHLGYNMSWWNKTVPQLLGVERPGWKKAQRSIKAPPESVESANTEQKHNVQLRQNNHVEQILYT